MTNQEAIRILNEQRNKFMDEWVDFGRVNEAYNIAIQALEEKNAVEPSFKQDKDGIFIWCCGSCGAYMYHIYDGIDKAKEYAKFCRQCGKPVLWGGR